MTTAAVEQYTGEGVPPYCEMTFRATDRDDSSPPELNVDVQIEGARKSTDIKLKKKAVRCVLSMFNIVWKESLVETLHLFSKMSTFRTIEVNKDFHDCTTLLSLSVYSVSCPHYYSLICWHVRCHCAN